jgi:hypothetical protein
MQRQSGGHGELGHGAMVLRILDRTSDSQALEQIERLTWHRERWENGCVAAGQIHFSDRRWQPRLLTHHRQIGMHRSIAGTTCRPPLNAPDSAQNSRSQNLRCFTTHAPQRSSAAYLQLDQTWKLKRKAPSTLPDVQDRTPYCVSWSRLQPARESRPCPIGLGMLATTRRHVPFLTVR